MPDIIVTLLLWDTQKNLQGLMMMENHPIQQENQS